MARDHLAYRDLTTDRQQRAYDVVREQHALTVSRAERLNSALSDTVRAVIKFAVGGWVWVHNTATTIRQGREDGHGRQGPQGQALAQLNGPYKVLTVGLCTPLTTPDGTLLGVRLLYLDLLSDMPGADAHRRVSLQRCKPCANPHDHGDMPKYLPPGLT